MVVKFALVELPPLLFSARRLLVVAVLAVFLIPVVGIVGASVLLEERLGRLELFGGVLILVGLSIGMLGAKLKIFLHKVATV